MYSIQSLEPVGSRSKMLGDVLPGPQVAHTHTEELDRKPSQATCVAVNGGLDSSNNWLVIHELLIACSGLL